MAIITYSAEVAGLYGEVQNLGSLAVRLVFWPVETSAFRTFSRFGVASDHGLAHVPASESSSMRAAAAADVRPGDDAGGLKQQQAQQEQEALQLLQGLHRGMLCVALLAACFAPCYAFTAVHVLLTRRWSATQAPALLAQYAVTLPVLASNGVLEACTHARMSSRRLLMSNIFMGAVAVVHAAGLLALRASSGSVASCTTLIALDAVAMGARVLYSLWIIWRMHAGQIGPVAKWLPSLPSVMALLAAHACTRYSWQSFGSALTEAELLSRLPKDMQTHALTGGVVLAALLAALWRTERQLRVQLQRGTSSKLHMD